MSTAEPRSTFLMTLTKRQATTSFVIRLALNEAAGVRLIAKGFRPVDYRAKYGELLDAGRSVRPDFRVIVDLPGGKPRIGNDVEDVEVKRGDLLLLASHTMAPENPDDLDDVRVVDTIGLAPFVTML